MRLLLALLLILLAPAAAQSAYTPRHDVLPGPVTGTVAGVLDGDTLDMRVKVWIGSEVATHVRIAGIDAPEMKGKCAHERDMARAAQAELARIVADGPVALYDIRLEKYAGRVLATARTADGADVGSHMIDAGLARPYGGERRKSWCG